MTRILLFTGVGWAFGTVHSELVKYMHSRGVMGDILDWSKSYSRDEMRMMADCYDYLYGVPGETWPLTDTYGIPHSRIIVVAHGEYDLQHMLATRDPDEINRFAGYAVISEALKQQSIEFGVRRLPEVVKYGVNCRRFLAPVPMQLGVVGYGGSMHRADPLGVDWKRGHLAVQATEAAGLQFRPAGQYHFLAMPAYYRQVDALLVTSLREGFGLPAMEAAAAGRLVIGTPVGNFPEQVSVGAGILAPVEPELFVPFVADRFGFFRSRPKEFAEACMQIRDASRVLDWDNVVDEWIALFRRPRSALEQRAPPDGAPMPPRQVRTHHGTIMYFSVEHGDLRHGAEGHTPQNLVLAQKDGKGSLMHVTRDACEAVDIPPLVEAPIGSLDWEKPGEHGFEIVRLHGSHFALRSHGLFLCAEPNGQVTLSRRRPSLWELFSSGAAIEPAAGPGGGAGTA